MKKISFLCVLAITLALITSCSGTPDKVDLKVDKVEISGQNSDLISVVPGTYSIVKTTDGLSIRIKLKLERPICNADSLELYTKNNGGLELSLGPKLVCTDANGMSIDCGDFTL